MNDTQTAIVLLAAGNASRMGTPKQFLDIGGKPMVRHAAETALASQCRPVVVVAGAHAAEIRAALVGLSVSVAENANWAAGMGSSIQSGLALLPAETAAVIVSLADQPLLTAEIYESLIAEHRRTGAPIVAAAYAGTVGVPVLFARAYFPHLLALPPDQGCKGVILKNREHAVSMPCPEAETDIDTAADYARLVAK
jgi:molybdenum cofactor cytidylyltransferase